MGFSGFYRLVFSAARGFAKGEEVGCGRFVRIRIYGIMGFSGFYHLVFGRQALILIRLGGIAGYGENRNLGESKS